MIQSFRQFLKDQDDSLNAHLMQGLLSPYSESYYQQLDYYMVVYRYALYYVYLVVYHTSLLSSFMVKSQVYINIIK
jgi:hypothetical protein